MIHVAYQSHKHICFKNIILMRIFRFLKTKYMNLISKKCEISILQIMHLEKISILTCGTTRIVIVFVVVVVVLFSSICKFISFNFFCGVSS